MLNSDVMKYKMKIANMLCANEDIVTALDAENPDLLYNSIYPYLYIPKTEEIVRCVICFALDFPKINKNEYFKESNLVFYVISHRNYMKTPYGGTRSDVIEGLIVDMLNWNVDIGLELKLKSSMEKVISDSYHARVIVFETIKFNSLDCGIKNGSR